MTTASGSEYREKIWLNWAPVASMSRSRSSVTAAKVFSCGLTTPVEKSSSRTRLINPFLVNRRPLGCV